MPPASPSPKIAMTWASVNLDVLIASFSKMGTSPFSDCLLRRGSFRRLASWRLLDDLEVGLMDEERIRFEVVAVQTESRNGLCEPNEHSASFIARLYRLSLHSDQASIVLRCVAIWRAAQDAFE